MVIAAGGCGRLLRRVRRSPRPTLRWKARTARPRRPSLDDPLIWLAHSLRTLVTSRGRPHGVPVAQRMLGQMRLFAAREFEGATAGWAC
jgi:hypothetical protein